MNPKPKTMKFRWYFLLFFLSCALVGNTYAKEKEKTENVPLDLIFRKVNTEDFNGSAYTISGESLRSMSVTNLTNVLSGVIPGFFSRQSSGGMKDESASYWLRGVRTYSEGILVLVDGQEREFGTLSPYEIESITALKDASATILYGMRAANGVILVKTRKGSIGKPMVEVSAQWINQKPISMISPMGAKDYAINKNNAMVNDGKAAEYSAYDIYNYGRGRETNSELYPDVDWLGDHFKPNYWVQRYNVNISGGGNKARYFVNGTFTQQEGTFITDETTSYSTNNEMSRYNIRSNVEFDVTKTTLLAVDLYGLSQIENEPYGGADSMFMNLLTTPSLSYPKWYKNTGEYIDNAGSAIDGDKIISGDGKNANPWALLNRAGYNKSTVIYGSFKAQLSQDLAVITKGLKISAILSMDAAMGSNIARTKGFAYYQIDPSDPTVMKKTNDDGTMANGVNGESSSRRTSIRGQVSWDRSFKQHNVSALAFYEQYESSNEVSIPNRYQGGGAWLSYNYAHKYSVDLLASYQGCYKFAKGDNFGFFPSVSAGWNVSNEKFFAPIKKVIPYLKIRASYGEVGNHRSIDEYFYMSRLKETSNVHVVGDAMNSNLAGYIEDVIANPNLTWELAKQTNIGVDLRMFDNRLTIMADYFHDDRTQMYVSNGTLSSMYGISASISENIGSMYTRGIDLAANWSSKIGQVHYNIGGTYSQSVNRVTALGDVEQPFPWMRNTGYFRGVTRGYIAEGFFNSWEEIAAGPKQTFSQVAPGDIRFRDVTGDGIVDINDKVPLGYGNTPQIFYGANLGLEFKGVGISAQFQGAANVSRYMGGKVTNPFESNGNIYEHQLNYWTPETGSQAQWPRVSAIHTGNNAQANTMNFINGNYLRLSSAEIYYNFPQSMLKKSFISGLRVFVSGYNLASWGHSDILDPEAATEFTLMPLTRNFSFGCSIKF